MDLRIGHGNGCGFLTESCSSAHGGTPLSSTSHLPEAMRSSHSFPNDEAIVLRFLSSFGNAEEDPGGNTNSRLLSISL